MTKKKVEVTEAVEVVEVVEANGFNGSSNVVFHKDRWDNDSGTNQLVADELPSLND